VMPNREQTINRPKIDEYVKREVTGFPQVPGVGPRVSPLRASLLGVRGPTSSAGTPFASNPSSP
ncbi:MAG: hypothetical protein V2I33_21125, partial [Kangiellaceae bacterium]|nr:hypothetical protein [Kangiellaceae bacterium]